MTTMRHGDYLAKIEYDEELKSFHGRIINIRDVVNFYGSSTEELTQEFKNSLRVYLDVCKEQGIEPSKPFSGRFNVRINPELHRAISEAAALAGKSLNKWLAEALRREVDESKAGA